MKREVAAKVGIAYQIMPIDGVEFGIGLYPPIESGWVSDYFNR